MEIDTEEFLDRVLSRLGDYYPPQSKKKFLKDCRKLLESSSKFRDLVADKGFWSAFGELTVNREGPAIPTNKPDITIRMDASTLLVDTCYADSIGPKMVTHGELQIGYSNDCLECRKVTERAVSDEDHEIKSEEHIYFEGIEFRNYEGRCNRYASADSDYGHGNMIPRLFVTSYGHLNNTYYSFDETIVRFKGTDTLGAYQENRSWKEDCLDVDEILLYRQDTQTPSIKSAPGFEPENITRAFHTHTTLADSQIDDMRRLMSDEQLDASAIASEYTAFGTA